MFSSLNKLTSVVSSRLSDVRTFAAEFVSEQQRVLALEQHKLQQLQKEKEFVQHIHTVPLWKVLDQNRQHVEEELKNSILALSSDDKHFLTAIQESQSLSSSTLTTTTPSKDSSSNQDMKLSSSNNSSLTSSIPSISSSIITAFAVESLQCDPLLNPIRYRLVPRRVSEEEFWRNYLSRVQKIRKLFNVEDIFDENIIQQIQQEYEKEQQKRIKIAQKVDKKTAESNSNESPSIAMSTFETSNKVSSNSNIPKASPLSMHLHSPPISSSQPVVSSSSNPANPISCSSISSSAPVSHDHDDAMLEELENLLADVDPSAVSETSIANEELEIEQEELP